MEESKVDDEKENEETLQDLMAKHNQQIEK
jgi:hypothetical protein